MIVPHTSVVEGMVSGRSKNALLVSIGCKANIHVIGRNGLIAMLLSHEKATENATRANFLLGQEIVQNIDDVFTKNIKNSLASQEPIGTINYKFVIILPMQFVQEAVVHPQNLGKAMI